MNKKESKITAQDLLDALETFNNKLTVPEEPVYMIPKQLYNGLKQTENLEEQEDSIGKYIIFDGKKLYTPREVEYD